MPESGRKKNTQGRPVSVEGEDRRAAILDSALNLFAEHGVAGTTIAQIAKQAGVTPAMVHYYFGNREGVVDALVEEKLVFVVEYVWSEEKYDENSTPREIITALVDRVLDMVEQLPQLPHLWSREVINAGGVLRERFLQQMPAKRFGTMSRILAKVSHPGAVNPDVNLMMVPASILGMIFIPLAMRDTAVVPGTEMVFKREAFRAHVLAVLLDGVCPENLEPNAGDKHSKTKQKR